MRPQLAWLLLFLTSFQWVGGRMVYRVVYTVEVKRQMNEAENAVSEAVRAETGIEAHVEIFDRAEVNIDGIGYSGFFMFSREMDGNPVYFQVTDPVALEDGEFLAGPGSDPDENSPQMIFFKWVFTDFTPHHLILTVSPRTIGLPERNFAITPPAESREFTNHTPPPEGRQS